MVRTAPVWRRRDRVQPQIARRTLHQARSDEPLRTRPTERRRALIAESRVCGVVGAALRATHCDYPSRNQMAKDGDWAGEFIDVFLDNVAKPPRGRIVIEAKRCSNLTSNSSRRLFRSGDAATRAVPCAAMPSVRRATIALRKIDAAGRPVCQIELCERHAEAVIARERRPGFEIFDRRDWR